MAFGFKKNKQKKDAVEKKATVQQATPKKGVINRLHNGLTKTRRSLGSGISTVLIGKKELDETVLDDLEAILISADIGVDVSHTLLEKLRRASARRHMDNEKALLKSLKSIMTDSLKIAEQPLVIEKDKKPYVVMMVGINGAGKTTTIGKLSKRLQLQQLDVMLAAGDTFRAAAIEQLQVWGERNNVPVVAQQSGADTAAVCFDALQSASARNMDVLIADTAGRLHTQSHLMDELSKVTRVMQKVDKQAPHETLLVLDASIGQNALLQAKQFCEAVNVTGIVLTKLDGTAKGGIIFAIVDALKLPIRFIGVGEQIEDLREFNAQEFVDALFA